MARHPVVPDSRLDKAIEAISPRWALKRRQARMGLAMTASYGAGGYIGASKKRTATQEWRTQGLSANDALLPDLATLRDRSQDAIRNNPIARGAINNVVTAVVGTGLEARPHIDRAALGMADAEADAWQAEALRIWNSWAYSQEADLARTLTFDGVQRVAFRAVLVDGDHFVAKRFLERPGSDFGLKAQLIVAARVCNPGRGRADTANLRAGIETDEATGAPIRYHIANRHPDERTAGGVPLAWAAVPAFGAQSGQRQVLHLMRPLEAGLLRGEPFLAPVIEVLRQCGTWTDAELMAAVINSCFAITTKTEEAQGIDLAESGATDAKNDAIQIAKPGTIVDLNKGESVDSFTPGRPSSNFDPFMTSMLRQIGMALEIPYEVLVNHFTSSYSAARAALLSAWRFYRTLRDFHTWSLCQPFYEAVITEAVARGMLAAPGFFSSAAARAAWCACEWYGPAPGSIDPLKEVQAFTAAIDARLMTRERATTEWNGGDYDANHKQLVKEQRDAERDGLVTPTTPRAQPDPAAPPDANDNEGQNARN